MDLFSNEKIAYNEVVGALKQNFGNRFIYEGNYSRFGVFCYIDSVKVDIIHYPHERIAPLNIIDEIRMYDTTDISAMKIQAILGRGRKKDFWDISELLQHFSIQEIVENHRKNKP